MATRHVSAKLEQVVILLKHLYPDKEWVSVRQMYGVYYRITKKGGR